MNQFAGKLELEAGITVLQNDVNVFLVLCQFILVKAFLLHTELLFIAQELVMTSISEIIIS